MIYRPHQASGSSASALGLLILLRAWHIKLHHACVCCPRVLRLSISSVARFPLWSLCAAIMTFHILLFAALFLLAALLSASQPLQSPQSCSSSLPCPAGSECVGGFCDPSICRLRQDDQSCPPGWGCDPQLKQCMALVDEGRACGPTELCLQCRSGFACKKGQCAAPEGKVGDIAAQPCSSSERCGAGFERANSKRDDMLAKLALLMLTALIA